MKYSQGKVGRIFVLRLEDKDKLPDILEKFARDKNVLRGMCIFVGGIGEGRVVVGPKQTDSKKIIPLVHDLQGIHEIAAVGTLFPDEEGKPRLHMHASLGRKEQTRTGCIRLGIEVANLGEIILLEITDNSARRKKEESGLLELEP